MLKFMCRICDACRVVLVSLNDTEDTQQHEDYCGDCKE